MITKAQALSELRPGERFSWVGDDYAGLSWEDTTPKPTEAEIDAKLSEIVADVPWRELRSERNARLAASDWTQAADATGDTAAWATYRQALRDLPDNTTDPENPVWPEFE
jgi:hypothetical protein